MSGMKIKKNEHGSAHALQVHLAHDGIYGHLMDLETQINCALVERSVHCHWGDPERPFTLICHQKENEKRSHSGSVMSLMSLAQSLYVLIPMTIDLVPLDVIVPATPGLLYILRHMATISASICESTGRRPGGADSRQRSVRT